VKFLIDMNLSPRWVAVFGEAGIEAAHWSNVGAADASDSEILGSTSANDYVVLTHDLDFGTILAITQSKKPSVVQIRAGNVSPDSIARQVIVAVG
jgi:predicted nuclease of predicted toxin-antitoxin system